MNDASGFVLRRLVVRRAEDSFLRETYDTKLDSEGRRNGKLDSDLNGREIDMSLQSLSSTMLWATDLFWSRVQDFG